MRRSCSGMTIVETLVAGAIASVLLAVLGVLMLYGLRSFTAMGNYSELDGQSRNALDNISRELRQDAEVVSWRDLTNSKTLVLSNHMRGMTVTFDWDATTKTLTCDKGGMGDVLYLKSCDQWEVEFYQRTPQPGTTMSFLPATNSAGALDVSLVKMVAMTWRCSMPLRGETTRTESIQTAQIVLRNKKNP